MRSKSLGQPIIPRSDIFQNDLIRIFAIGMAVAALLVALFIIPVSREQLTEPAPLNLFTLLLIATALITVSSMVIARYYLSKVEQLRAFSDRDELTGLYLRSQFDRALVHEANRSIRYKQSLSLLLLRIDDYDEITKKVGLREAKMMLKHVGQMIHNEIRNTDLGFLYKEQDTFAILLPSTTGKNARVAAQRIRDITNERSFRIPETGEIINITLSISIKQLDNETIAQSNDGSEMHITRFNRRAELLLEQAIQRGNKCLIETPKNQHVTS